MRLFSRHPLHGDLGQSLFIGQCYTRKNLQQYFLLKESTKSPIINYYYGGGVAKAIGIPPPPNFDIGPESCEEPLFSCLWNIKCSELLVIFINVSIYPTPVTVGDIIEGIKSVHSAGQHWNQLDLLNYISYIG